MRKRDQETVVVLDGTTGLAGLTGSAPDMTDDRDVLILLCRLFSAPVGASFGRAYGGRFGRDAASGLGPPLGRA